MQMAGELSLHLRTQDIVLTALGSTALFLQMKSGVCVVETNWFRNLDSRRHHHNPMFLTIKPAESLVRRRPWQFCFTEICTWPDPSRRHPLRKAVRIFSQILSQTYRQLALEKLPNYCEFGSLQIWMFGFGGHRDTNESFLDNPPFGREDIVTFLNSMKVGRLVLFISHFAILSNWWLSQTFCKANSTCL